MQANAKKRRRKVQLHGVARAFSPTQLLVQTLVLQCSRSPHVQTNAQHLRIRKKSQTLAAIPLFGHAEILHTLVGVGSTTCVAAVALPRQNVQATGHPGKAT